MKDSAQNQTGGTESIDNGFLPRKVLLHACCAVCMAYPVELLRESGFEPVVWFYNPNIYPETEYQRRRDELIRYCEEKGYEYLIGDYEPEKWRQFVQGLENEPEKGARCEKCFEFRLDRTAQKAKELGIKYFTTTLTVSPHKVSRQVFAAGEAAAEKVSEALLLESDSHVQDMAFALHRVNDCSASVDYMKFLKMDFKKQDGFLKTMKLAKENNFYRQQYCGCEFSYRF